MVKQLLLKTIAFLALAALPALATTTYVSQSGGTFSGGSACNGNTAITPSTWENTSESAGDITYVCGAVNSELTYNWSGTSASPLQLIFDSGASITYNCDTNGCLNLNNQTNIVVNGGVPCGPSTTCSTSLNEYGQGTSSTGVIQQLNNGGSPSSTLCGAAQGGSCGSISGLPTITNISCSGGVATVTGPHPFGLFLPNQPKVTISGNSVYNGTWTVASNTDASNQFTFAATCSGTGTGGTVGYVCPSGSQCNVSQSAVMINNVACGTVIENMMLGPSYIRWSEQDISGGMQYGIYIPNGCSGSNGIVIHDSAMPGNGIGYVPAASGDNAFQFYNNSMIGTGDSIVIAGSTSGNNLSGAQIHDNYIADNGVWDTPDCRWHLDGIHIWGLSGAVESNVDFYNNWFAGNFGGCQTGAVYFEGDNVSDNIYNNVMTATYTQANNGVMSINGPGPFLIANNTILGQANGDICFEAEGNNWSTSGGQFSFENNVVSGCNTLVVLKDSPSLTTWDKNAYSVGGYNLNGTGDNWSGGGWQAACACDPGSMWYSASVSLDLNSSGVPQTGSPVIGVGANLYSVCSGKPNPGLGALCYDAAGNARPTTGAWDAGAYQRTTSAAPLPPTNLVVTILN